jgi:type IV secretion system protein VirB6
LAAAMLSGGGPGGGTSLAASFDAMLEKLGGSASTTLDSLHMFTRGVTSVMCIGLQALVAASAGLILIFALIMITIHVGLAPLFIGFSIFSVTKDMFYKWVQSTLTYALSPVVIAAVLGSMIRLTEGTVLDLNEDAIGTVSALIPFIVVLVIMTMTILLIPMIVSGLSGAISSAGPLTAFQMASGASRAIAGTPGMGQLGNRMGIRGTTPPAPPEPAAGAETREHAA